MAQEFTSKLEDLMPAEELLFDATPGFGKKYKPFLTQAIAHPAKMNTRLTEFLIENFTKQGGVILDPMSGSGQTGVVAALLGRNAVCIELEEKFYKWQLEAKAKLEDAQTLRTKGKMACVLGDARALSQLMQKADVAVTPYSGSVTGNLPETERHADRLVECGSHGDIDAVITSPPYADSKKQPQGINLEHEVSIMETDTRSDTKNRHTPGRVKAIESLLSGYGESDANIGNLPVGDIDCVLTSPPYADGTKGPSRSLLWERLSKDQTSNRYGRKTHPTIGEGYGKSAENIGNLPFVDAVITSPPYSEQAEAGNKDPDAFWNKAEKTHGRKFTDKTRRLMKMRFEEPENIGNLKKETYLEAMAKVYSEMWKVLKQQGKAIIIIKPFIRQKKVVDLPLQTWLLMEKVGFNLVKLYKLRLKTVSFWRLLYSKKYPDVPKIAHEYILIAQKGDDRVGSVHVEKEVIA